VSSAYPDATHNRYFSEIVVHVGRDVPGGCLTLGHRLRAPDACPPARLRLTGADPYLSCQANSACRAKSPESNHRHKPTPCSSSPMACLGCEWIDQPGTSMAEPGWREASAAVARRHESSHGEFRGQPDQ
jgi:hypothetical protein